MNFETLQERVGEWVLDLPETTAALIGEWINDAIRKAEERHNFKYMEATSTAYVTAPATRALGEVPARFKEVRGDPWFQASDGDIRVFDWAASEDDMNLQYGDDTTLDVGEPEFLHRAFQDDGTEVFQLYPFSDGRSDYTGGEYRIFVPYWRNSALLTLDEDTNWLTTRAPDYVIYKATSVGMFFNRDETRGAGFAQMAEREYIQAKNLDKRSRIPPKLNLNVRHGVHGPAKRPRYRGLRNNRGYLP